MADEHELHPEFTPAMAGSLQQLQELQTERGLQPAKESLMRRPLAIAIATFAILASLGAVMMSSGRQSGKSATSIYSVASANPDAGVAIDMRRSELLRRIDDARNAGHLKGVGYMMLLSEHQALLVAQRRAEAQGMSNQAVLDLNAALDHASANLERHLHAQ